MLILKPITIWHNKSLVPRIVKKTLQKVKIYLRKEWVNTHSTSLLKLSPVLTAALGTDGFGMSPETCGSFSAPLRFHRRIRSAQGQRSMSTQSTPPTSSQQVPGTWLRIGLVIEQDLCCFLHPPQSHSWICLWEVCGTVGVQEKGCSQEQGVERVGEKEGLCLTLVAFLVDVKDRRLCPNYIPKPLITQFIHTSGQASCFLYINIYSSTFASRETWEIVKPRLMEKSGQSWGDRSVGKSMCCGLIPGLGYYLRDWHIPGAHGPASLAYLMSFRLARNPVSR